MAEWVSVKDQLPEDLPEYKGRKAIRCLVSVRSRYPNGTPNVLKRQRTFHSSAYYPYSGWGWSHGDDDRITHWMPLPDPPEADNG